MKAQGSQEVPTQPDAGNKMTQPDSSSAAPSLEGLRQRWLANAERDRSLGAPTWKSRQWTRCADDLKPILDHERSLVARLQALDQKWHEVWFEEKERNRSLVAEIQRLTDSLQTYGQHKLTCQREVMRHADDSAKYLSEPCTCGFTDALPETPHEKRSTE